MINSELIYKRANELKRQCQTNDVFQIAKELGIRITYCPDFGRLLGMYLYKWRQRHVFLNSHMEPELERLVLAHEIGHDTLHRSLASSINGLQEFTLFDMRSITEYEANAMAAHLLLDSGQVYHLAREGYDIMQMSQFMETHMNLLLIKMQEMNRLGYDFRLPGETQGDFLKNVGPSQAAGGRYE